MTYPKKVWKRASQSVTDLTSSALPLATSPAGAIGSFTDKGTPGAILGRKAKAFTDFGLPILDFGLIEGARPSSIQNLKSKI